MSFDRDWAVGELRAFVHATDQVAYNHEPGGVLVLGTHSRESDAKIAERVHVVERVLDRVLPAWRGSAEKQQAPDQTAKHRWDVLREWSARGIGALEREAELEEKLGDASPRLSARGLHPWVWEPARLLWRDGHFRAALHAAASSLTSQIQAKTGRLDLADKALIEQVFSLGPAASGKPRLRVMPDDGSPTYRSAQEGAMHLGVGLFQGVRNRTAHDTKELDESIALERLAAFSVFARWADEATLIEK